jgi:hypothetical protein
MLVAAALVPDTVLLVPGAAGRDDVLADLRAAALDAVAAVLDAEPELIVVVAPGRRDGDLVGPVRASLTAAGIPDGRLGWSRAAPDGAPVVGVAASVGLLMLARSGWTGPVRVVEVGPPDNGSVAGSGLPAPRPALHLRSEGAQLVEAGPGSAASPTRSGGVGMLVVGSHSARHGPDAPLADDERAPAYDAALLADLADGGPAARARLAALDPGLARELGVTGWGPWQVLLGSVGDREVDAEVLAAAAPFGAQHVVATWLARPARTPDRA